MKRKPWLLLFIPALAILLLVYVLQPLHRAARLLEHTGIPVSAVQGIVAQDYWYDWLEYTDGYDWIILRVSPDTFSPPSAWTASDAALSDIKPQDSERYHYFNQNFREHPALPETFTAWQYIPADPLIPRYEQEWFAGMYDAASGILALYRGHALYGMIPGL